MWARTQTTDRISELPSDRHFLNLSEKCKISHLQFLKNLNLINHFSKQGLILKNTVLNFASKPLILYTCVTIQYLLIFFILYFIILLPIITASKIQTQNQNTDGQKGKASRFHLSDANFSLLMKLFNDSNILWNY